MSRIKEGELCLIVGANAGREDNIGATVTVTTRVPEEVEPRVGWQFKDASREILIKQENEPVLQRVFASTDLPSSWTWLLDGHLMPIRSDGEEMTQAKLKELEL